MRLLLFAVVVLGVCLCSSSAHGQLSESYYKYSCPNAEEIVHNHISMHVARNPALPSKFLRLQFHDCFVDGCDASVLIDSTPGNRAEKDAIPNKSLTGFRVIDQIKAALEKACPETVSCADIVALAARDAVSFQYNRDLWKVELGRRDGRISKARVALANIPSPFSDFSTLVSNFSMKGLNIKDLVVLSGAHTIGMGHCNLFSHRLYNFTGKGDQDPSLNPSYAAFLKTQCKSLTDTTTIVPMDPGSFTNFDSHYYTNLKMHQGLFQSDAALLTDQQAAGLVNELVDQADFFCKFADSMIKMGRVQVKTGRNGEIRKNCRVVNP